MENKHIIATLVLMGLTQAQIAKESGLHESTISLLASGKREGTNLQTHNKLTALLRRERRKAKRKPAEGASCPA